MKRPGESRLNRDNDGKIWKNGASGVIKSCGDGDEKILQNGERNNGSSQKTSNFVDFYVQ